MPKTLTSSASSSLAATAAPEGEAVGDLTGVYSGAAGAAYYAMRLSYLSDDDQAQRAGFFSDLTDGTQVVLDFGCGTGGVLARLPAQRRIGVEISEIASAVARSSLDSVYGRLSEIADESIDLAISFHALEHVPTPFESLQEIFRVMKPGGVLRLVVPYDNVLLNRHHRGWQAGDRDMHLFAWTPLHIGNLLTAAGFAVDDSRLSPWSRGGKLAQWVAFSPRLVRYAVWIKAIRRGAIQVIVTCRKPAA